MLRKIETIGLITGGAAIEVHYETDKDKVGLNLYVDIEGPDFILDYSSELVLQ